MAVTVRTEGEPDQEGPIRRLLAPLAVGVVVAVAAVFLLSFIARFPRGSGPTVRAKFDYYEQHADEFDLLFVGSSHFMRTFDPNVVDEVLREGGLEVHSFNLGVAGMRSFETDEALRWLVEHRPERLRWVVVELGEWDPRLMNLRARRSVSWHTTRQMGSIVRSVRLRDKSLRKGWEELGPHVEMWGLSLCNVGYGPPLVADWLGMRDADYVYMAERLDEGRGFLALDRDDRQEVTDRHASFLAEEGAYLRQVEAMQEPAAPADVAEDLAEYNVDALREQVAMLRAAGLEPIYVVPAVPKATPHLARLGAEGDAPILIELNDLGVNADVYRVDHRYDPLHVNGVGAEKLSRRFARAFLSRVGRER